MMTLTLNKEFRLKSRLLLSLLATLVATMSVMNTQTAHATTVSESLLFGQKQAYSAVVRTDQKVVTYAKLFYNNPESTPFSSTSFTVPDGVEVSNLSAYQILLPTKCDGIESDSTKSSSSTNSYDYSPSCTSIENDLYNLDSSGYYYQSDVSLRYKQISLSKKASTYTFNIPESIAPEGRGAILVSYIATKGYVSGALGFYNLTFKTLQVPQSIQQVNVSVDVASDLYTRANQSSIEHGSLARGMSISAAADSSANIQNKGLDELQSSIGSGGTFSKTGKSLVAGETFVVNGEFADAAWKLNIAWIIGGFVALMVVVLLAIFLLKKASSFDKPSPVKGKKK